MEGHPLDLLSLVAGLLYVGIGLVLFVGIDVTALELAWALPVAGLGGGLLLLAALWSRREG